MYLKTTTLHTVYLSCTLTPIGTSNHFSRNIFLLGGKIKI